MQKILICGDSFAADWSSEHQEYLGWPCLLAQKMSVCNRAQAGCSEYKIYKQLSQGVDQFDAVIVCHTSPYRIPVEQHPLHKQGLHINSDLIYKDIENRLPFVSEFFEKCFWPEYALFVHGCILKEEQNLLSNFRCLHITMTKWDGLVYFENFINFENIFYKHKGLVNHLSSQGNKLVFEQIMEWLR